MSLVTSTPTESERNSINQPVWPDAIGLRRVGGRMKSTFCKTARAS
jgi:hypothetical protein